MKESNIFKDMKRKICETSNMEKIGAAIGGALGGAVGLFKGAIGIFTGLFG